MITLEQRAATLMTVIETEKRLSPKKAETLIIESFRLLIEDCARIIEACQWSGDLVPVAEAVARQLAADIRAQCNDESAESSGEEKQ